MVLISVQTSIISPLGNGHDFPPTLVSLLQRRTQRRCPWRPCVCVTPLLTKPQAPQEALPDLVPVDLSGHLAAVSLAFISVAEDVPFLSGPVSSHLWEGSLLPRFLLDSLILS